MNLIESLQISPVELTETGFKACMELSDFQAQPQGYLNGGAGLAAAEITAGMASNVMGKGDYFAVGQTVSASHLQPTKAEGQLDIIGELLLEGKSSHVWDIRLMKEDKLISSIRVTNALIASKKD